MRLLFKLTTKGRPDWANRAIQSIKNHCVTDNTEAPPVIIITVERDDPSASRIDTYSRTFPILLYGGVHNNKVEAINNHIPAGGWDVLINVSDDQAFDVTGFDQIIADHFKRAGTTDRVLFVPDKHHAGLMTMSIIGFDYYCRDRYVYHSSYQGQYCDNEAQEVAALRGCLIKHDKPLFNHWHPNYYPEIGRDTLYQKYDRLCAADMNTYNQRKANNFYL